MINQKSQYDKIASDMTQMLQNEIRKKGLVKTGTMLKSVKLFVKQYPQGYNIELEAVDYFWILDHEYKIIDSMMATAAYKATEEKIIELQADAFVDKIDEELFK